MHKSHKYHEISHGSAEIKNLWNLLYSDMSSIRINSARSVFRKVFLPDFLLHFISDLCIATGV